jgi:hypothetical protein
MSGPDLTAQADAWIAAWEATGGTFQWMRELDGISVTPGTIYMGCRCPQSDESKAVGELLTGPLRPAVVKRLRERLSAP